MNSIVLAILIVSAIGVIAGIGLSLASVALEVPVDEKQVAVRELLPGANCGGCGYSGCDAYAEAVAKGEAEPGLCAPGGAETAEKISALMGVSGGAFVPHAAYVRCFGGCAHTKKVFSYRGTETCAGVNTLFSGDNSCNYGCLGRGDCAAVCPTGAISVNSNGVAEVDDSLCTGCGKCVKICPKGIIDLRPLNRPEHLEVTCSNKDKGPLAKKACSVACIGCGLCVKACEFDAVHVTDHLAAIDPGKCTRCGKCAEKCPEKCILVFDH